MDADPVHLRMAEANAAVYGVAGQVRFEHRDVRDTGLSGVTAAFIDPARRTGRGRLRPGDSEPPLAWCLDLAGQVSALGIKAAPGIPRELVPPGWETEFIAVGRELKEAALWSPALARSATRATILPGGHTLTPQPGPPVPVAPPGPYLLDPNPAVTRPAWWPSWPGPSAAGRSTSRSRSCAPPSRCVPRSPAPSRCSIPAGGISASCPPGCARWVSARWTSAAAAWPATWPRSGASSSCPARTGPP